MKRLSVILFTLILAIGAYAANPTAAAILDNIRRNVLSKDAVEAKFTINGGEGPVQGSMTISGAKFAMLTPHLKVWYDGRTQWTYLASTGEVSITEPTADELAASNPFAILSSYSSRYDVRRIADVNGCYRVELIPKAKDSGIEKIVVVTDPSGNLPRAITITFDGGQKIEMVVDHIGTISKPSDTSFRYNEKLQPASEIIDLR